MIQTAAVLQDWLVGVTMTGGAYDPAANRIGLATAIDDHGEDTVIADVTPVAGAGYAPVGIGAWGAPYRMRDGRWATDATLASFHTNAGQPAETVTHWFIQLTAGPNTLKAFGPLATPQSLPGAGAPVSLVLRLTIDPEGRFDASVVIGG